MEFRILGPLDVVDGDRAISFDAPKLRALLGVLLLHPNEVVSADRLIDELWGERPPATAAKVLQTYVSQLRKAIGADAIVTRAPGYQLNLDGGTLDADRFRQLTNGARRLAAAGDAERAAAAYREALGLWRGGALADAVFESFARNEVERLEEEQLAALADRIDCDLMLGRHHELVGELEELAGQHPLRERFRAQLMLALYRAGRQSDALAAFRDARRTLQEELGLEPGQELRDLERAILAHDPALQGPPPRTRGRGGGRRARRWQRAALAALVLGAAALALAFVLGNGERAILVAPNSVGFIDAESGRVARSFRVGREPRALAVSNGSLWVANYRDQTVSRVDRSSGVTATIPVGGHPTGIASYRGKVWVWTLEERLVPIDPRFDAASDPYVIHVAGAPQFVRTRDPGRIVAGGGFLWLTAPGTTIIRLDPRHPRRRLAIVPDAGVQGPITYGEGAVWAAGSDFVFPISAATGVPGSESAVGGVIQSLAFAGERLWVVSGGPNRMRGIAPALRRVDPHTGLLQTTIEVGQSPGAVAAAAGSIWVASRRDGGTVYRVDAADDDVVAAISVGATPTALVADEGGLWVAAT